MSFRTKSALSAPGSNDTATAAVAPGSAYTVSIATRAGFTGVGVGVRASAVGGTEPSTSAASTPHHGAARHLLVRLLIPCTAEVSR
jgi:hypothetical protein